ncbi:DNA-directed RNA polymerase II subunit RPB1 [Tetrabaena socialis]|uniref:DNA-directed RNA polymerase II subunit RPB1 n=1 Tax=Tetrabaena socialis TaxID=47790 RepID=A0A2J7ZVF4_9CHLO|nr:DNA-directed RNA polymerase II subunit RPB1 [Tetrabaena socialis]|eukprot:PNH04239.1 DNA-directed RNA polymerase II subunit RPB1 [Tetrabaena socialis]
MADSILGAACSNRRQQPRANWALVALILTLGARRSLSADPTDSGTQQHLSPYDRADDGWEQRSGVGIYGGGGGMYGSGGGMYRGGGGMYGSGGGMYGGGGGMYGGVYGEPGALALPPPELPASADSAAPLPPLKLPAWADSGPPEYDTAWPPQNGAKPLTEPPTRGAGGMAPPAQALPPQPPAECASFFAAAARAVALPGKAGKRASTLLRASRTDEPHGRVWLDPSGPIVGRTGVVRVSHCGYAGSVSADGSRFSLVDAGGVQWTGGKASDPIDPTVRSMRAAAVCAKLGFRQGRYKKGSKRYGLGSGLVFLADPICREEVEQDLEDGDELPSGICLPRWNLRWNRTAAYDINGHAADLSVDCYDDAAELLPPPPPHGLLPPGAPPDGTLRLMSYTPGLNPDEILSNWGVWAPSERDKRNGSAGYVQVALSGVWGAICADGWDDADADVACRQLGFSAGLDASGRSPFLFPVEQGLSRWRVVHMTRVECPMVPPPPQPPSPSSPLPSPPKRRRSPGADLSSCPHSTSDAASCHYRDQAAIRCFRTRADAAAAAAPPPPPLAPPAPPLSYNSSSAVLCIELLYDSLHLAHGMALLPHDACARSAAALTPLLYLGPLGLAPPGFECAGYGSWSFSMCGTVADAWVAAAWVGQLRGFDARGLIDVLVEQVGLAFPGDTRELDYDYGSVGGTNTDVMVTLYGPGLAWPAALAGLKPITEASLGGGALADARVRAVLLSPPPQAPDWSSGELAAEPPEGDGAARAPPGAPPPLPPRPFPMPRYSPPLPHRPSPTPPYSPPLRPRAFSTQRYSPPHPSPVPPAPRYSPPHPSPVPPAPRYSPPLPPRPSPTPRYLPPLPPRAPAAPRYSPLPPPEAPAAPRYSPPLPPRGPPAPLYSPPPIVGCYNSSRLLAASAPPFELRLVGNTSASSPSMTLGGCAAAVRQSYGAAADVVHYIGLAGYVLAVGRPGGGSSSTGSSTAVVAAGAPVGGGPAAPPPRPPPPQPVPQLVMLCYGLVGGSADGTGGAGSSGVGGGGVLGPGAAGAALPLSACRLLPCAVPPAFRAAWWPWCGGSSRSVVALYSLRAFPAA